jgi:hypothetical protein
VRNSLGNKRSELFAWGEKWNKLTTERAERLVGLVRVASNDKVVYQVILVPAEHLGTLQAKNLSLISDVNINNECEGLKRQFTRESTARYHLRFQAGLRPDLP